MGNHAFAVVTASLEWTATSHHKCIVSGNIEKQLKIDLFRQSFGI